MTEARPAADPILKAAHGFLLLGFAVLPVDAEKRAVFAWKELQDRFPCEEELDRWWPDGHHLNLAVLTGPISGGLAVLDIDDADLAERMAADGALTSQTTAIRTPRGGLHLWVIETNGRSENGASASGPLLPGVADLKARGGYVLVPPSRTSDGQYSALNKLMPVRVDNARAWALTLLREYGVAAEGNDTQQGRRLDVGSALDGLTPGNRNDTLTRVAGKLHRAGWGAGEIVALLSPHAERVDFPLAELEGLVRGLSSRYPQPDRAEAPAPSLYQPDSLDTLLNQADDPLDSAIGDGGEGAVLTSDGKGFVAGPTGVGKTNLLLRLSRCLCEGVPFLGLPVPQSLGLSFT